MGPFGTIKTNRVPHNPRVCIIRPRAPKLRVIFPLGSYLGRVRGKDYLIYEEDPKVPYLALKPNKTDLIPLFRPNLGLIPTSKGYLNYLHYSIL